MKRCISLLLLLLIAGSASAQAEKPEINVEVDRTRIQEGQSVNYKITLNHVESLVKPNLDGFEDFDMELLAQGPISFRSTTIINGRTHHINLSGQRYEYRLTPRKTGTLRIPAPTATVNGKVLRGREVTLNVRPADDQDVVQIEITSDPQTVYPLQPFTVTLRIFIWELPADLADRDPVSLRVTRTLSIPWADRLPDGVTVQGAPKSSPASRRNEAQEARRWLKQVRQSPTMVGFSIDQIRQKDIFAIFDGPLYFQFPSKRVKRKNKSGKEVGYWEYSVSGKFIAERPGEYAFGPVTLEGTFATSIDARRGELVGEEIYIVGRQLVVIVKDAPTEGRPDDYTGAIGRFTLAADLSPTSAKVGDPMTLTVALEGQGTFANTGPPKLELNSDITERFRIYEPTESTDDDQRIFTYSIRPLMPDVKEFPPISMSYFDVDKEEYVSIETEPIPVSIAAAERLAANQIVGTQRLNSQESADLQAATQGIFANISDPAEVQDDSIAVMSWLLGLGGLFGAYGIIALVTWHSRAAERDPAFQRRRGAASRARGRIQQLGQLSKTDPQRIEGVRDAVVGLVADSLDLPEAGLTAKEASDRLLEAGISSEIARRVLSLLESCEAARFGLSADSVEGLEQVGGQLVNDLIAELRGKGCLP